MKRPTKFEIKGLFGSRNIELTIQGNALILVGPNGIGKSTVTNMFYFYVSRQWGRLAEYEFDEIAIWFDDDRIQANRADIMLLSQFEKVFRNIPVSSRVGSYIGRLTSAGLLEEFVSTRKISPETRRKISGTLNISPEEVRHVQMSLFRHFDEDSLISAPKIDIERKLAEKFPGRSLYLPTYRRIEKELKQIFPDLEERLRSSTRPTIALNTVRAAKHYVDLVSFGMEDVRSNIDSRTRHLRDYSLAQFNELSGTYLRDVINGTAEKYSPSQISELSEGDLSIILGRVSEQVLSDHDKALLRQKIIGIKTKFRKKAAVKDRYLAHYFSLLMSVSTDIAKQEKEVSSFVEVCNAYLKPSKKVVYDDSKFTIEIKDDREKPIDISSLSSGEKQVISLFSHLYLDDARDQIVIIDEPELSLSVPWQKRFLPDILASNRCGFVLSVTHSPFIYQNELRDCAVDLRRMTKVI